MPAKSIGAVLRHCRESADLSVERVAAILSDNGIAKASSKTIYGWENGVSQPKPDVLLFLCKIYGITDVLGEFGFASPTKTLEGSQTDDFLALSNEEKEMLCAYRAASPEAKRVVDLTLEPYKPVRVKDEAM